MTKSLKFLKLLQVIHQVKVYLVLVKKMFLQMFLDIIMMIIYSKYFYCNYYSMLEIFIFIEMIMKIVERLLTVQTSWIQLGKKTKEPEMMNLVRTLLLNVLVSIIHR